VIAGIFCPKVPLAKIRDDLMTLRFSQSVGELKKFTQKQLTKNQQLVQGPKESEKHAINRLLTAEFLYCIEEAFKAGVGEKARKLEALREQQRFDRLAGRTVNDSGSNGVASLSSSSQDSSTCPSYEGLYDEETYIEESDSVAPSTDPDTVVKTAENAPVEPTTNTSVKQTVQESSDSDSETEASEDSADEDEDGRYLAQVKVFELYVQSNEKCEKEEDAADAKETEAMMQAEVKKAEFRKEEVLAMAEADKIKAASRKEEVTIITEAEERKAASHREEVTIITEAEERKAASHREEVTIITEAEERKHDKLLQWKKEKSEARLKAKEKLFADTMAAIAKTPSKRKSTRGKCRTTAKKPKKPKSRRFSAGGVPEHVETTGSVASDMTDFQSIPPASPLVRKHAKVSADETAF